MATNLSESVAEKSKGAQNENRAIFKATGGAVEFVNPQNKQRLGAQKKNVRRLKRFRPRNPRRVFRENLRKPPVNSESNEDAPEPNLAVARDLTPAAFKN